MITAKMELKKLESSLRKASDKLGETNKAAVARWGVACCRELAHRTQPYGSDKSTRIKSRDSIEQGMFAVCKPVDARTFKRYNGHKLNSPEEISRWVDSQRTGEKGHAKLSGRKKPLCKKSDFTKAKRARTLRGGMAKGAWIGAGQKIAKWQKGVKKLNIGKNFLGWTQKHADKGTAKKRGNPFKFVAKLLNNTKHSKSNYVLKKSLAKEAVQMSGELTLKWYEKAGRKSFRKK